MTRFTALLLGPVLGLWVTAAHAATVRVPQDRPTLQAAVAAAYSGDTIEVGAGRWCGAVIEKQLHLVGRGDAVIVAGPACPDPSLDGAYRVGLYLKSGASGSTVRHLSFDGSNAGTDPAALAYGVYAEDADRVKIEHTKVRGTLAAFVDLGGDDWVVQHNDIRGVSARGTTGGRGIVVQARSTDNRPANASISHNRIRLAGLNPDGSSAGVYLAGATKTKVTSTRVRAQSDGVRAAGVLVTSAKGWVLPPPPPPPAFLPAALPGGGSVMPPPPPPPTGPIGVDVPSDGTDVTMNDGKKATYVLFVDPGNAVGLHHRGNLGVTSVEGEESSTGDRRDAKPGHGGDDDEDDE